MGRESLFDALVALDALVEELLDFTQQPAHNMELSHPDGPTVVCDMSGWPFAEADIQLARHYCALRRRARWTVMSAAISTVSGRTCMIWPNTCSRSEVGNTR